MNQRTGLLEKLRPLGRGVEWLRSLPRKIPFWIAALLDKAEPGPRTKRGARWGAVAALMIFGAVMGSRFSSPFGPVVDVAIGVGLAYLLAGLGELIIRALAALLRTLPRFLTTVGAGAFLILALFLSAGGSNPKFGFPLAVGFVLVEAVLVGAVAFVTGQGFRQASKGKRVTAWSLLGLGVAANLAGLLWLAAPGKDDYLIELPDTDARLVAGPEFLDPGQPGAHEVLTLTYGSGSDRYRPEYCEEVGIQTESVDATPFVKGFKGWRKRARDLYWGFTPEEIPLNGRIWYPEGEGPFPLVLIVHGNHNMSEFSDPGYAYLGEFLASRGFIFVSVDENFLNGSFVGGIPRENDARGWILLKHLELWRDWAGDPESPFAGKVDLENIALIGHSRGGEAAAIAAAFNRLSHYPDDATVEFDFGFSIRGVIAIAPSDGQYNPADQPTPVENVNYLVVQGGHDSDVSLFLGDRQYNRVRLDDGGDWFKASVYIYRANHGQFNTVWGRTDIPPPLALFLNRKPLMAAEDQRRLAKTYFSAFLEASLRGRREYVELFRNPRLARSWLPDDLYITRYEDGSFRLVTDYEEDVDVTTTSLGGGSLRGVGLTLWREGDVELRKGQSRKNNGVYLGWNYEGEEGEAEEMEPASYAIHLPPGLAEHWSLGPESLLVCQLAASGEKPPLPEEDDEEENEDESEEEEEGEEEEDEQEEPLDFTLELVSRDGAVARLPLSHFGILPLPLKMRFTRLKGSESRYGTEPEPVLQTYELPLSAFAETAPSFDPTAVETIRFVFDDSPKGVVILDRVGFAHP